VATSTHDDGQAKGEQPQDQDAAHDDGQPKAGQPKAGQPESQDAPAAPASPAKPPAFWALFTRDDVKPFLLTFAATVAGALVSVMVVAVAVLLARWQAHMHAHPRRGEMSLKEDQVIAAAALAGSWLMFALVMRTFPDSYRRIARRWLLPVLLLVTALVVLSMLGFAAGVK
jgi:hypothetical protein